MRPASDFDRLDPSLFRAFLAAAETENFTKAAALVAMTQSGVSQHVAKLEAQLGVGLFVRVNKAVQLSEAGRQLVQHIERYLDDAAGLVERFRHQRDALAGLVSYAMPGSCLLSPHLGMMLEQRRAHPGIELRIGIRPNAEIADGLLAGDLDFGFLTEAAANPGLVLTPFCDEEFVLAAPTRPKGAFGAEDVRALEVVTYPGFDAYFDAWWRHFFPGSRRRPSGGPAVKGAIESIHGAIALVAGGVGASVFPRHCVAAHLDSGAMHLVAPKGKGKGPLLNTIFLTTLAGKQSSRRAQQVIDWFFAMHPEVER